jgi:hypothetical protein
MEHHGHALLSPAFCAGTGNRDEKIIKGITSAAESVCFENVASFLAHIFERIQKFLVGEVALIIIILNFIT